MGDSHPADSRIVLYQSSGEGSVGWDKLEAGVALGGVDMDDFLPSVLFGGSPLVGRDGEVRAFTGAVEAAVAGGFQFLTVVGEPGVGKTRLLAELATLANEHGLTALS